MTTLTARHSLTVPDLKQTAWGELLQTIFSELDSRLPWGYNGDPNTNVAGKYIGQPIYDYANARLYHCTAVGTQATSVWVAQTGVPSGVIMMWSGSIATIPTGYVLCDGNNSTPDLRDKFIVGARSDDEGVAKTNITGALTTSGGNVTGTTAAGGAHTHAGTTDSAAVPLQAHTHGAGTFAAAAGGAHTHEVHWNHSEAGSGSEDIIRSGRRDIGGGTLVPYVDVAASKASGGSVTTSTSTTHTHTISGTSASEGSGDGSHTHTFTTAASSTHTHTVEILPVYYALAYIMKV